MGTCPCYCQDYFILVPLFPCGQQRGLGSVKLKVEDGKSQRLGNLQSQGQATRQSYLSNSVPTLQKCTKPSDSKLRLDEGLCELALQTAHFTCDSICALT